MKKLISIFLILLMLVAPLASCGGTQDDTDTSDSTSADVTADTTAADSSAESSSETSKESEQTTETDEPEGTEETYADGLIRLSNGGKALYRIVRGQNASSATKSIATDFTKHLNTFDHGATFELKTDTYPITQYLEIHIGVTSSSATTKTMGSFGVGGWSVQKIGGKIAICGSTTAALKDAISYFNTCISVNEDGDLVLYLEDGKYTEYGKIPFFSGNNDLSAFTIVYESDFAEQANELKAKIKEVYKVDLPLKLSTQKEGTYEILIGACARAEATEALSAVAANSDGYIVKATNTRLIIAGRTAISTKVAANNVINSYMPSDYLKVPQIPFGVIEKYDTMFGDVSTKQQKAEGAEVRIMSFNVLSELFCDITSASRKAYTAGTILAYMPDVIGFQEFDGYYQGNVRPLIADTYEIILGRKNDNSVGYNGIAYNTKTLTLIDKGYVEYRKTGQGRNHKYLAYGVFKTKSTNETFALVNLHWDINGLANDYKMMQCEDTVALIASIREQYSNCPVFVTGDYNTNRHTDYFQALLTNASMQTSEVSAAVKINDQYNTYHGVPLGTLPGIKDTSIDHIVHTSNVTSLRYQVIIDLPTLYASDHNPVIADFALN